MERIIRDWPQVKVEISGHNGNGKPHVATDVSSDGTPRVVINSLVHDATRTARRSISAEHGAGFQKRDWLGHKRSARELALMHTLKHVLNPDNLLSLGRISALTAAN